ncbi:MAG: hypothetical protein KDK00_03025 [Rhodobacteraceae bacterium]|nr:hypothetical protein [Paracoccaceae bacterium]
MNPRGKPVPRRRGTALTLVVLCLLVSGLIRAGGSGGAIAKEVSALTEGRQGGEPRAGAALACEPPPDVAALLAAIRTRQDDLDQRRDRLENRIQALNVAEAQLKSRTQALIAAEQRLAATLAIADNAAEQDLARLTAVYENMKAKDAAGLFAEMAPEFAAGFLARMRPDSAASVMAGLDPGKAYRISLVLAGRNAAAPRE